MSGREKDRRNKPRSAPIDWDAVKQKVAEAGERLSRGRALALDAAEALLIERAEAVSRVAEEPVHKGEIEV
ncbi:MAG TPA: hypothetical protein DCR11_00630, partial [Deltaproteobacteria bacterium]|nr:hypothetical protein [Deltaproteobacteria bacterium]